MLEKYESGALHPSKVFELYKSMDVYDREKFLDLLSEDENLFKEMTRYLDLSYEY